MMVGKTAVHKWWYQWIKVAFFLLILSWCCGIYRITPSTDTLFLMAFWNSFWIYIYLNLLFLLSSAFLSRMEIESLYSDHFSPLSLDIEVFFIPSTKLQYCIGGSFQHGCIFICVNLQTPDRQHKKWYRKVKIRELHWGFYSTVLHYWCRFLSRLTHLCLILIAVIQSVREIKENLGLWEFGDSKL